MTTVNNTSGISATQDTSSDNKIDKQGKLKGKSITATSAKKNITATKIKKFLSKSVFARKVKKNTTEQLENSSQVKASSQQKKNLAIINNIEQAIKKYQEFHEDKNTKTQNTQTISDKTLQLLQKARSECNIPNNDKAKSTIKELLTSIGTDLHYDDASTADLKYFRNEYAKDEQKYQKQTNKLYKNTPYSKSSSKLNDAISNRDYNNSLKNLLNDIISFRSETANELKPLDEKISSLSNKSDKKSKQDLNATIAYKNELIDKLKIYKGDT
jgi:hypothetical protein